MDHPTSSEVGQKIVLVMKAKNMIFYVDLREDSFVDTLGIWSWIILIQTHVCDFVEKVRRG